MQESRARHAARRSAHAVVGARLRAADDRELAGVVAAAPLLGSGIGGRRAEIDVGRTRVFVKRVPLTDLEARPAHAHSTANLFGLPLYYQYGVGSAGFGAWRELAAHRTTTAWALAGSFPGVPLLYHWRVLPDRPPEGFADEFGGVEGAVAHWEGSAAVRRRLEAIGAASHSLVLFLEHLPQTLAAWLAPHRDAATPGPGSEAAYLWVEEHLRAATTFLRGRGFVHFDAHFANLMTDGHHIHFGDLGLALSRDFALAPDEAAFLDAHLDYDRSYAPGHLLRHHLPAAVHAGMAHTEFLQAWAGGRRPHGVPPGIAGLVDRHVAHALVMDGFARRLLTRSKRTPFPTAALRRALDGEPPSA